MPSAQARIAPLLGNKLGAAHCIARCPQPPDQIHLEGSTAARRSLCCSPASRRCKSHVAACYLLQRAATSHFFCEDGANAKSLLDPLPC